MSYSIVKSLAEDTLAATLTALIDSDYASIPIYKGFSGQELTCPRIEVLAPRATPERYGQTTTGNWTVHIQINVVTHLGDYSRSQHNQLCGAVDDVLMVVNFEQELAKYGPAGFVIYTPGWIPGDAIDSTDANELMTTYEATLYCAPGSGTLPLVSQSSSSSSESSISSVSSASTTSRSSASTTSRSSASTSSLNDVDYLVQLDTQTSPDVHGTYTGAGSCNGQHYYSNGTYKLWFNGVNTWVIGTVPGNDDTVLFAADVSDSITGHYTHANSAYGGVTIHSLN